MSGRIDGTVSGGPPITEIGLLNFGSGIGNLLHVGGFGYVNSVIVSAPGGVDVQVDNNGQLFCRHQRGGPHVQCQHLNRGQMAATGPHHHPEQHLVFTPVVLAHQRLRTIIDANAKIGLQFGSFISSGTTAAGDGQSHALRPWS